MITTSSPNTRRSILSAASQLLIDEGFQDVSLDEVARKAGVAKGTIFIHFKNKDDLFFAVFAELVDRLGEDLERLAKSSWRGRELLIRTIDTVLLHFDRHQDFISHFGAGRFPGCGKRSSGKLSDKFARNLGYVVDILKHCADSGLFQAGDFEAQAVFLFGMCRSSLLLKKIKTRKESLDERARRVAEFFLKGAAAS